MKQTNNNVCSCSFVYYYCTYFQDFTTNIKRLTYLTSSSSNKDCSLRVQSVEITTLCSNPRSEENTAEFSRTAARPPLVVATPFAFLVEPFLLTAGFAVAAINQETQSFLIAIKRSEDCWFVFLGA